MQLYNKLSAEERRALIKKAGNDRLTISFYKYFKINNIQEFRDQLFVDWEKLEVLGRTYVATEGINAQISIPANNLEKFKEQLYSIDFMKGIRLNVAVEQDSFSFLKNKIKIRKKIVADAGYAHPDGVDFGRLMWTSSRSERGVNADLFYSKIGDSQAAADLKGFSCSNANSYTGLSMKAAE